MKRISLKEMISRFSSIEIIRKKAVQDKKVFMEGPWSYLEHFYHFQSSVIAQSPVDTSRKIHTNNVELTNDILFI